MPCMHRASAHVDGGGGETHVRHVMSLKTSLYDAESITVKEKKKKRLAFRLLLYGGGKKGQVPQTPLNVNVNVNANQIKSVCKWGIKQMDRLEAAEPGVET